MALYVDFIRVCCPGYDRCSLAMVFKIFLLLLLTAIGLSPGGSTVTSQWMVSIMTDRQGFQIFDSLTVNCIKWNGYLVAATVGV